MPPFYLPFRAVAGPKAGPNLVCAPPIVNVEDVDHQSVKPQDMRPQCTTGEDSPDFGGRLSRYIRHMQLSLTTFYVPEDGSDAAGHGRSFIVF